MKSQNKNKYVKGNISEFSETNGYFIGRFLGEKKRPELETDEVEIAWKKLPTIFNEKYPHFHKKGIEVNIVVSGEYRVWVEDTEIKLKKGDFLVVYPETKLRNLTAKDNTEVVVVKAPSLPHDKFDAEKQLA